MKRLIIGLATVLGACEGTADASAVAAATLKDPSSAQFRDVRQNGENVCGEMNGKNSFGAYSGFQRFVVIDGERAVLEPPADDTTARDYFEIVWSGRCGAAPS